MNFEVRKAAGFLVQFDFVASANFLVLTLLPRGDFSPLMPSTALIPMGLFNCAQPMHRDDLVFIWMFFNGHVSR